MKENIKENIKENMGIIKEIDKIGRIVVPKDQRDRFMLQDYVEIIPTNEVVLIRNPEYRLIRIASHEGKLQDKY